jgi:hypothetical protein
MILSRPPRQLGPPSACKAYIAAIGAAVISVVLAGCGSTPYDLVRRDRQHSEDERLCAGAGFKPGSNQFATCMQDQDLARMRPTTSDSVSPR